MRGIVERDLCPPDRRMRCRDRRHPARAAACAGHARPPPACPSRAGTDRPRAQRRPQESRRSRAGARTGA
eukprot:7318087-Pyramimonas_sp.AAC.1